ncbi:MAG: hypothetical protein K0B87_04875, partial [Candidatus Syntrophosphaera sp.]|nr:hypothetical protein [Candidatus Syntrophosphaera sp.]
MDPYYKLTVKCPSCGQELGDESKLIDGVPAIKLITQIGDKNGTIWLSSYYGSYEYESTFKINEGEITTFKCPHCLKDLTSSENCNVCHAPLV